MATKHSISFSGIETSNKIIDILPGLGITKKAYLQTYRTDSVIEYRERTTLYITFS